MILELSTLAVGLWPAANAGFSLGAVIHTLK